MNEDRDYRRVRGSLFFPLLLIALGIVFLLDNLRVLPGSFWDTLITLWPVLLIAMGLDGLFRRQGLVGPVILISLGTVFLMSNLGLLVINVWEVVLRLWPIVLVAFGLDLVIGKRSLIGSITALVIVIALLAGALWIFRAELTGGQLLPGEEISQSAEGINQASVILRPAVGTIHVGALPESSELVQGVVRKWRGEQVRRDFRVEDGKGSFNLSSSGASFFFPGSQASSGWEVSLNPSIPLDIEVGLGVGEAFLDLEELEVTALDVDLGVGKATVVLPASNGLSGDLSGAIGELVVIIPSGMEARIQSSTGLATVEAPPGFRKQDNTYTTSGYGTASQQVDIKVSQAIGKITIQYAR